MRAYLALYVIAAASTPAPAAFAQPEIWSCSYEQKTQQAITMQRMERFTLNGQSLAGEEFFDRESEADKMFITSLNNFDPKNFSLKHTYTIIENSDQWLIGAYSEEAGLANTVILDKGNGYFKRYEINSPSLQEETGGSSADSVWVGRCIKS
jgi:hypothetical protein